MQFLPPQDGIFPIIFFKAEEIQALRDIPLNADATDSPEAERRLYPKPIAEDSDGEEGSTQEDWEELMVPELKEEFSSAMEVVVHDLKTIQEISIGVREKKPKSEEAGNVEDEADLDEDEDAALERQVLGKKSKRPELKVMPAYLMPLPLDHAVEWYSAMNQARLVMVEKSVYVSDEGEPKGPADKVLAYELYTQLQSVLLDLTGLSEDDSTEYDDLDDEEEDEDDDFEENSKDGGSKR
jgi:hypothetical protein